MHHQDTFSTRSTFSGIGRFDRLFPCRGTLGLAAVAWVGLSTSTLAQVSYDITGGNAVEVNNAFFFPSTSQSASGTGVYNTFYRLSANDGTLEGYNTGIASRMPDVANTPNIAIRLNNLTVPANNPVLGVNYYSFGLDINEPANANAPISLDNVEVWISGTQLTTANTYAALANGGAQRIYSLDEFQDSEILVDYRSASSGSGRADMIFLIPQSLFPTSIGGEPNYFIYLYSAFGGKGGVWRDNQGFEEWQTVSGLSFTIVPESSTWAAAATLAGLAGVIWMRRRSTHQQA